MQVEIGKKYRIYRSVRSTFPEWDELPETLAIDKIVTVVSVEDDKNVVVRDEKDMHWFIRYTSLANIEEEVVVVAKAAKKDEQYNWDDFKKKVAAYRNDLVVKSQNENFVVDDDVKKRIDDAEMGDKRRGLASFFYNNTSVIGGICYANAMGQELSNFGASFYRLKVRGEQLEAKLGKGNGVAAVKAYADWIVKDSAFAGFFSVDSYEELIKGVSHMLFDKGEEKGAISACIALRMAYEYEGFVEMWWNLVSRGVEENIAFFVAHTLWRGYYNRGDGHSVFSCLTMKGMVAYLKRDLDRTAKTIFEVSGNSKGYGNRDKCFVGECLKQIGFMERDQYGYEIFKGVVNEESTMKLSIALAKAAEKVIQGE